MSRYTDYFIKVVLIPCLSILSITLLLFFTSHGASVQTYFPVVQRENNIIPNTVVSLVESNYGNYYDHYFLYGPVNSDPYYPEYFFVAWTGGSVYANMNSNSYQFTLSRSNNSSFISGSYRVVVSNGSVVLAGTNSGGFMYNITYTSSLYSNSVDFAVSDNFLDSNDNVIIFAEAPIVIPNGSDPTAFDDTGMDLDSSLVPSTPPTPPTTFTANIPTAPVWDSSQPVQSVWDYLVWGFNVLKYLLQAIIEKFIEWFTFIGNLIGYVIQKIIDAIRIVVEWLYNQFLNWLTPYLKILSFISGLLFNEDEQLSIFDVLFNLLNFFVGWCGSFFNNSFFTSFFTNLVSSYQTIQGYFESLQSFFSKVVLFFTTLVALGSVNGEFSIPVLFQALFIPNADSIALCLLDHDVFGIVDMGENLLTLISNYKDQLTPNNADDYKIVISSFQIAGQTIDEIEIDFSWYLDFKNIGDPVISAFLVFGYFMWLHSRFPYWLRGQQGDISKATQEIGK